MNQKMNIVNETIEQIIKWKIQRENLILNLRTIIKKLHKLQKNVDISKLTGNSISIIGAGLAIFGFAMTPFTFGISLGIVLAGSGLGVVGSLTTGGANIVNYLVSNLEIKKAVEMLEKDRMFLEEIKNKEWDDVDLAEKLKLYVSDNAKYQFSLVKLNDVLVMKIFNDTDKLIENSKLALDTFILIFNSYHIRDTATSLLNGSKSELAKKLEGIVNLMEKEIQL